MICMLLASVSVQLQSSDAPFCWKTGTLTSDAVHCLTCMEMPHNKSLPSLTLSIFYRRTQEDAGPLNHPAFHHSKPLREKAPTCLSWKIIQG